MKHRDVTAIIRFTLTIFMKKYDFLADIASEFVEEMIISILDRFINYFSQPT